MANPPLAFPATGIRAFLISPDDTVKLAVLSGPSTGSSATVVFEIWEPGGAQPPNSHPDSAETFVVRGFEDLIRRGTPVPLDAADLALLTSR